MCAPRAPRLMPLCSRPARASPFPLVFQDPRGPFSAERSVINEEGCVAACALSDQSEVTVPPTTKESIP
jgi:hypothetical protein